MIATLWLRLWAAWHRARLWWPVGWDRYTRPPEVELRGGIQPTVYMPPPTPPKRPHGIGTADRHCCHKGR